jgi:hypothetical protein
VQIPQRVHQSRRDIRRLHHHTPPCL